jgi:hypothetical protein
MTVKAFFKKLLLGNISHMPKSPVNPLRGRINNIKAIWNNDHQDDNGIEKIVRLFLSTTQLLFPGIYIKYLADKRGAEYQDLAMDLYILLKVAFPVVILMNHYQRSAFIIGTMIYLLAETVLYIPTLIFASDSFATPRSYKRSMLLLFLNYSEIVFSFAVLYSCDHYLNKPFAHWFDPIYFSAITSSTVGYGDYYPVTPLGKFLSTLQALLFLFFVVLFLNFFSKKIKSEGYFNDKRSKKRKKGSNKKPGKSIDPHNLDELL